MKKILISNLNLTNQKIANIIETTSFNKLKSHEKKMDLKKLHQELFLEKELKINGKMS